MSAKIYIGFLASAVLLGGSFFGPGISAAAEKHPKSPCQQIEQACKSAGFVYGDSKQGKGIMHDCVNPIMQSKPAPGTTALPSADPSLVSACKAKNPKFGAGEVGHSEMKNQKSATPAS